jgi:queuine/archaeosine tRNA-ribosyltransferase
MERIREAVREGRYRDFRERFLKVRKDAEINGLE